MHKNFSGFLQNVDMLHKLFRLQIFKKTFTETSGIVKMKSLITAILP